MAIRIAHGPEGYKELLATQPKPRTGTYEVFAPKDFPAGSIDYVNLDCPKPDITAGKTYSSLEDLAKALRKSIVIKGEYNGYKEVWERSANADRLIGLVKIIKESS